MISILHRGSCSSNFGGRHTHSVSALLRFLFRSFINLFPCGWIITKNLAHLQCRKPAEKSGTGTETQQITTTGSGKNKPSPATSSVVSNKSRRSVGGKLAPVTSQSNGADVSENVSETSRATSPTPSEKSSVYDFDTTQDGTLSKITILISTHRK